MKKQKQKILISPLDWGLGHAVRDIPLIHELIDAGYDIIIAGSGISLELLKKEFPDFKYYQLSSSSIRYSKKSSLFLFKMLFQIPKFIINIKKEYKQLQKIIGKERIDLIISDNRYGVYSKIIPSIFISHQIFIKLPKQLTFFEKRINTIQKKYIQNFNKCLIPDFKGSDNLSGDLSHKTQLSNFYQFIGSISRFKDPNKKYNKKYDIIVIISGPEPQRTAFYQKIYPQVKEAEYKTLIVLGKPGSNLIFKDTNVEIVNHLSGQELQKAILSSIYVITRAGYTSIMDLVRLKKKAILIPTTGQSEQMYLADYLANKHLFVFESQNNFCLKTAIDKLNQLKPDFDLFDNESHESFIEIINNSFSLTT